MLDYRRIQRVANRTTTEAWNTYEHHRKKTMQRIREGCGMGMVGNSCGRMLIVGVGNANDLDLAELTGLVSELWLVDIDETALRKARARAARETGRRSGIGSGAGLGSGVERAPDKVKIWSGDAGGRVALIDAFLARVEHSPQALAPALLELAAALSGAGALSFPGQENMDPGQENMDVVVSQCILSQILWPVAEKVWENTGIPWSEGQGRLAAGAEDFPYSVLGQVLRQLALSHLTWLEQLLRPGGVVLINSDILWQGVPIYGANPLALLHEAGYFPERLWKLEGADVQEWDWSVEESVQALVQSVIARKPRGSRGVLRQFTSGA